MAAQSMQRALKGDLDKLTERLASDRVQAALAAGDLAAAGTALGDGWKGVEEAAVLPAVTERSEEHTSELQSLMRISYAVFCLKKKNCPLSLHTLHPISSHLRTLDNLLHLLTTRSPRYPTPHASPPLD